MSSPTPLPPPMLEGQESELKLAIPPAVAEQVRRSRPVRMLKRGRALTRHLRSVYFDTADMVLREHGMSLRVRHIGTRRVQTVKSAADHSLGLSIRREWECDIEGDAPDLAAIGDPALRQALRRLLDKRPLQPMFESDIRRTAWQLHPPLGGRVELALDVGALTSGDRREPVHEVELELKEGGIGAIFDIATELAATIPFAFESRSKADRGFALASTAPPDWVKAKAIALSPGMTVQEAFVAVAGTCLAQAEANEAAALDGRDPEGVHQLRVACRRLRSAFSLFRPVLPPEHHALAAEVKWFAGELGDARDWDVFLAETLEPLSNALPGELDLEGLRQAGERRRVAGYERVRAAIGSARYTRAKLDLRRWLADRDWHRSLDADGARLLFAPVTELADHLLERRSRKVSKLGRRLDSLALPELHELRIRGKKLRYATEFFASLYEGGRAKEYTGALAKLQDVLGVLNDSVVAHSLVQQAAAAEGAESGTWHARVDGIVTGWCAAQAQVRLSRLQKQWQEFGARKRFWQKHPSAVYAPALERRQNALPAPAPRSASAPPPAQAALPQPAEVEAIRLPAPSRPHPMADDEAGED